MTFTRIGFALAVMLSCGTAFLPESAHADDRAYLIATLDLKFEKRDAFHRAISPCAAAVQKSGITLETYAIDIGNAKKVIDIWGGPSVDAILKSWEHPACGDFPLAELAESETLEAATMLNFPYGKQ